MRFSPSWFWRWIDDSSSFNARRSKDVPKNGYFASCNCQQVGTNKAPLSSVKSEKYESDNIAPLVYLKPRSKILRFHLAYAL